MRSHANIDVKLFKRSKCREVWNQHKWLECAVWSDRSIRRGVSVNINVENCHVDSFDSFHELVKSIDGAFDNHADIIFDDFLMKESVILSYHCKGDSDFLIYNNFTERE